MYSDILVKNLNVNFKNNLTKYTIKTHEYYKNQAKLRKIICGFSGHSTRDSMLILVCMPDLSIHLLGV